MNDYNIEFSHIYLNEQVSEEHKLSYQWFKLLRKTLSNTKIVSVIMIDDYNVNTILKSLTMINQLRSNS